MLDKIAGIWKRRKWIAVVAFALPASVVVGLATSLPNVYRSTATVLVERQQVPEAFVRPTVTGEVETRLQTMSQAILSRSRLTSLHTRADMSPPAPRPPSTRLIRVAVRERRPHACRTAGSRAAPVPRPG